jgi:Flp pilus assembly protein CpaB
VLRLRFLIRRLPILYWVGALALVLCTGAGMARLVGGAQAAAAQFGALRPVPVATHEVLAGTALKASDVTLRRLPAAVIPSGEVARSVEAVVGRVTLVPLAPGEVVTSAKVAPSGLTGVSALLPPDSRGLAIPTAPGTPPLQRGDHVDVLASFDLDRGLALSRAAPTDTASAGTASAGTASAGTATADIASAGTGPAPTFPVARHALVLDVGHQAITVAVTPDEAPRLAYALTHGAVTLALTAP